MLSGLFLIALGVLILVEPKILVVFLSGGLIASGFSLVLISWRLRRLYRSGDQAESPWRRFIVRF